jgi:uncharacterized membrane protein required for colicin V production
MQVYDWVVIGLAGVFILRGWRRGLVREAVELGVLFFGTLLVFRFSPVIGTIITGMANVPYEVGRIVGGVVMFLALVVGGAIVARLVSASLKVVPGATTLNRVGGGLVGGAYAMVIVVLATTLISAAPMPEGARETIDASVEGSIIGGWIVSPGGVVQVTVSSLSGEEIFGSVIAVRDAVGDRLAAGTLPIPLPGVTDDALVPSQVAAQTVFDDVNRHRIAAGVDPLAWSPDLASVAVERANQVYQSGFLSLDGGLAGALVARGVPGTIHAEMVAVAATPQGIAEALSSAEAYEVLITDPTFRLSGVGVVEGPYGLIAVQVFSG